MSLFPSTPVSPTPEDESGEGLSVGDQEDHKFKVVAEGRMDGVGGTEGCLPGAENPSKT